MAKKRFLILALSIAIIGSFATCATIRTWFVPPIYGAALWVNGEMQILHNSSSQANSVFAYGDDVYVAGRIWDSVTESSRAALWVNSELQTLSNSPSLARSVFVYDNTVYVTGSENGRAVVWVNGIVQQLDQPQTRSFSEGSEIYVSGTTVYVVGLIYQDRYPDHEYEPIGFSDESIVWNSRGVVWVNGTPQILGNNTMAHGIHISGDDIYVTGSIIGARDRRAALWINGAPQTLTGRMAHGDSVFVYSGNVYVMGVTNTNPRAFDEAMGEIGEFRQWRETGNPTLWVNGEQGMLRQSPSDGGSFFVAQGRSVARSVLVSNGNVFIAGVTEHFLGMQAHGTRRATLWVNGEPQTLHQMESNARDVFVSGDDVFVAGLVRIN